MSEGYIQRKILEYLTKQGAYAVNIHGNEYQSNVPDVLVCYRGRFIGIEVKDADGNLSSGQRKHLRRIQKAGGIGEGVRSLQRVKDIIQTINDGGTWSNNTY
jgi:hypothetical protein